MEDNLFSKEQIEQIKKANSKIRADLGLDKYDPKKDTADLKRLLKKAEKSQSSSPRGGGGGGGGLFPTERGLPGGKRPLKMKHGGMMKKGYAAGGAMPMGADGKPTFVGDGKGKMAAGGMAKMAAGGGMMSKMRAGGGIKSKKAPSKMSKVKTSAKPDGVAKKGLTKGKMVGMRGR
jgi:hypothetical protein